MQRPNAEITVMDDANDSNMTFILRQGFRLPYLIELADMLKQPLSVLWVINTKIRNSELFEIFENPLNFRDLFKTKKLSSEYPE